MKQFSKIYLLGFSILGGIIMSIGWPLNGFSLFLLIGFIPFIVIEEQIQIHSQKYSKFATLLFTYPGFLLWNILTTYWIMYSTIVGGLLAMILNALFMSIVFQIFHVIRKKLYARYNGQSDFKGYFILIVLWITYEYLHLNWELSWSWLQLGNGFSAMIQLIQWYEFTGVLGGTLWILLVNIMIYILIIVLKSQQRKYKQIMKYVVVLCIVILLPISYSLFRFYSYEEKQNSVSITVVQPNIDPYGQKFDSSFFDNIWDALLTLSDKYNDSNVDYIVWPETSIPGSVYLNAGMVHNILRISEFLKENSPDALIISGADAYELYDEQKTATARTFRNGECCYDSFNSALEIDTSGISNYYHKSKLVPGVERIPYPHLLKFLNKYTIDLGGTTGSLGMSNEAVVFDGGKSVVAPIICYESIYGEYVTEFVKKGAEILFIITNDGWWDNSPGHRQHMSYASLRAIETRRSIARSANTGISCFVNQRGELSMKTNFWEPAVIHSSINSNDILTIYVRYGDYLGRMSLFATVAVIIILVLQKLKITKMRKS